MNTNKLFFNVALGCAAFVLAGAPCILMAASSLGISNQAATTVYNLLQGGSWAIWAVSVVAGAGLGGVGFAALMAVFKKFTAKQFVAW